MDTKEFFTKYGKQTMLATNPITKNLYPVESQNIAKEVSKEINNTKNLNELKDFINKLSLDEILKRSKSVAKDQINIFEDNIERKFHKTTNPKEKKILEEA